jgi:hypothetical protein
VAIADPPYPRQSHLYKDHPDYAGEVDHDALIERLLSEYPDGWALFTSSPALHYVTGLLETRGLSGMDGAYRIGAWVKPFCAWKAGNGVAYTWEPVIFVGGRLRGDWRDEPTVRDFVSEPMSTEKGVAGAKPQPVCFWLFSVLNLRGGDTLDDLFPGSGAIAAAWRAWAVRSGAPPERGEQAALVL